MSGPATAPGRPILVLVGAQSLYLLALSVVFSFSSIVSRTTFAQAAFPTLPLTVLTISAALATFPFARVMMKYGLRTGLVAGAAAGASGAAICAWSILANDFTLYIVGHAGLGAFQTSAMYYRFAAADAAGASPAEAHAISWVIGGGVAAALIGPEFAAWTRRLATVDYVGSFAAVAALLTLAGGLLGLFRVPRRAVPSPASRGGLLAAIRNRVFVVAAVNGSLAYIIMSYVMSAAPLAVTALGHDAGTAATITRWHLIGMLAPSLFTARLIEGLGIRRLLLLALVLLVASAGLGTASADLMAFRISLFGLGIGWNFLFIGATALLEQSRFEAAPAQVRAANDLFVLSGAAAATLAAGGMHSAFGWTGINLSVLPLIALAGGATWWLGMRTKPPPRGR